MSLLLQATARVPDWQRMEDGLAWLHAEVGDTAGLISLRVFRDSAEPAKVTMLEEWESREAFDQSFAAYSLEQRAEFLARLGLTADDFDRTLWSSTGIEFGPGGSGPA